MSYAYPSHLGPSLQSAETILSQEAGVTALGERGLVATRVVLLFSLVTRLPSDGGGAGEGA